MTEYDELRELFKKLDPGYERTGNYIVDKLEENNRRRSNILKLLQEAVSQLRIDMKYLLFDLECTREERNKARQERDELIDKLR